MKPQRHATHGNPRFLRKVDIEVIFPDRNFGEHRKKELQPVKQVYPHCYAEAKPEEPISEDTAIGGNLKRNLNNRIREFFVFYPLLPDERG